MRVPRIFLALGLLLVGTACSDSTSSSGDDNRPSTELNILRIDATSPPLLNPDTSFYAGPGS